MTTGPETAVANCIWSLWPTHACGSQINWGDVPTGLAAVFAAAAAYFGVRAYLLEQQRDRLRDQEALRAQAERVSIYFRNSQGPELVLQNLSDQPVTDPDPYLALSAQEYAVLRPRSRGAEELDPADPVFVPVLGIPSLIPPQSSAGLTERPSQDSIEALKDRYHGVAPVTASEIRLIDSVPAGVRFTDASGQRRWHRMPDGRLEPDESK